MDLFKINKSFLTVFYHIFLLCVVIKCTGQQEIGFRLDMRKPLEAGLFNPSSGDRVILWGSFNDWQGNEFILEDNNRDSIFSGSFNITGDSGAMAEYKFVILKSDGKTLWGKNPNPENEPNGNRTFSFTGRDQEIAAAEYQFNKYYLALVGKEVAFTVEELQHDFVQFRKTLENEHCCLYEYTSKETFDSLFQKQYELIVKSMSPYEFYNLLSPITAKVGCMHTSVWMPGDYWDMEPENLFPLKVKLLEDYVVVSGYYNDNDTAQVPVGSIIMKINDRPVNEVICEMRSNLSADGFNAYFIDSQIEKRFPMIYARRYGFPEKYTVTSALPGRKTRVTKELLPADIQSVRAQVFKNFNYPELTFKMKENENFAIMTIPTFIYYDRVDYFSGFLDSCFNLIRQHGINNLILDLRGNDGGDPFCAVDLLSHLEHEPVPYFAERYGRYADLADPVPMAENHFQGNLYTLADGYCGSTNGHFCALLKYHGIGKFVGTPTGATYKCNAGRDTEIRLDNTGIILIFGRSTYSAAVKDMDKTKPIMPDYPVKLTYRDFLDGRDVYMEKALQLIEELKH